MRNREASILVLPNSKPATAPARPTKGVVIPLHGLDDDLVGSAAAPGSTWDELTKLALEGWCWRDPESLARIEDCVRRLWPEVEREWGEPPALGPIKRPR